MNTDHNPVTNNYQVGGDHYINMAIQPWEIIDTWPDEQRIGFYRGNALKYLLRMGSKDARIDEARKALHYMEKLVAVLGRGENDEWL